MESEGVEKASKKKIGSKFNTQDRYKQQIENRPVCKLLAPLHLLTRSSAAIPGARHTHMLSFETTGGWSALTGPTLTPHSYYLSHPGSPAASKVDNRPQTLRATALCSPALLRLETVNVAAFPRGQMQPCSYSCGKMCGRIQK